MFKGCQAKQKGIANCRKRLRSHTIAAVERSGGKRQQISHQSRSFRLHSSRSDRLYTFETETIFCTALDIRETCRKAHNTCVFFFMFLITVRHQSHHATPSVARFRASEQPPHATPQEQQQQQQPARSTKQARLSEIPPRNACALPTKNQNPSRSML
ncbi:unnamed protein product [Ectocarpus fasciculatus]